MSEPKNHRHYVQVKVLEKTVNIGFFERLETEDSFIKNNYNSECQHAIHQDFRDKLAVLKGHLIRICEQEESDDYTKFDESILNKFRINGFTISGTDESEGVILTGMRKLKSGQWFNLVTPLIRFQNLEGYDQVGELYHDIQQVNKEADGYLKGKFGEGTQWSLSFEHKNSEDPNFDDDDHPTAEPAKVKKSKAEKVDKE